MDGIDTTILLCTLTAEVFLPLGYVLRSWEKFLEEGRLVVLAMLDMMGNYMPEEKEDTNAAS